MRKIKVSVILPVYNVSEFLPECMDSITNQTLKDIEIICVNDGSLDNSLEILNIYAQRDSRIIIINQKNAGAGAARNAGMCIAKGQYLSFLDSDDIFKPEMLEISYKECVEKNLDFTVYKSQSLNNNTKILSPINYSVKGNIRIDKDVFSCGEIERDCFRLFVGWTWDKLFKRDFVMRNNLIFQEQRTTNDMLFVFSALVLAERISIIDEYLAIHRVERSDALSVTRENSWDCFYKALIGLKDFLNKQGLYGRYEKDYINYALHFSLWNLNTITGEKFEVLYNSLRESIFDELGVTVLNENDVYHSGEYAQYRRIMDMPLVIYQEDMIKQLKLESQRKDTKNDIIALYCNSVRRKGLLVKNIFLFAVYLLKGIPGFDKNYYESNHKEAVRKAKSPLLHFFIRGVYFGYNPNSEFDVYKHVVNNPEIVINGQNAFTHYLKNT